MVINKKILELSRFDPIIRNCLKLYEIDNFSYTEALELMVISQTAMKQAYYETAMEYNIKFKIPEPFLLKNNDKG